ncbi:MULTISPECIES: YadA-like family protein [Megasphaera]|nr:YadA-like family protein [Megasphaera sp. NM10]
MDFAPDDKGSFAVGFGSYKSEHAAALGASK